MIRLSTLFAVALGLAISALPQSAFAQDEDYSDYNILEFVIPEGKTLRRTTTTTKTTTENGKTQTGVYTGVYELQIEPYEDGFIVTKTRQDYSLNLGTPKAVTPEQKTLENALADSVLPRKIAYYSDESLAPYQIANWEEFYEQLYAALSDLNSGRYDRKAFDSIYGNIGPEGGVNYFLKDDNFLSIPHNIGLKLNEPITGTGENEAPLGGSILMVESIVLSQWAPEYDSAFVEYQVAPDPASLKTYIDTAIPLWLDTLSASNASSEFISKDMASSNIEITTKCRFEMVISTGLVKKGVCETRTVLVAPSMSYDNTETYEMAEEWLP